MLTRFSQIRRMSMVSDVLIVGGGVGGLTALACMMDRGVTKIAWVDPHWNGGRVGQSYREVPRYDQIYHERVLPTSLPRLFCYT